MTKELIGNLAISCSSASGNLSGQSRKALRCMKNIGLRDPTLSGNQIALLHLVGFRWMNKA